MRPKTRLSTGLGIAWAAAMVSVGSFGRPAGAADVETRWTSAISGSWENAARWSNGVPVNTAPAGTTYAATIDATGAAYTVQINPTSNAKASSVTLDSPDATLRLETGLLEVDRLIVRRGTVLTSGSNVIRDATIEYTPGAIFGGNVALQNVSFATDVTFTGGGTAFPDGLDTDGHTITFAHVDGNTHAYPFGAGTHITGGGAIVSDSEHFFESMYIYAPGGSMTIDAGVEVRTGSGHFNVGPASHVATESVLNRGTLRAGTAFDGGTRSIELTNVTNEGLIVTDRGRILGLNLANDADIQLAGRGMGSQYVSSVDKLVNDGTVDVSDDAVLIVRGLDNRGQVNVTGARLGIYDQSFSYGTLPLQNTGSINLHDAELELGIAMASDQVDVAFNRTGTKALIAQARLDNTGRTITVSPTNKLFVGNAGRIVGGTIAGTAGGLVELSDDDNPSWGVFEGVTLAVDWTLPTSGRNGPRVESGLTLSGGATIHLGSGLTFIPSTAAHTLAGNGRISFTDTGDPSLPAVLNTRHLTLAAGVTVEAVAGDGWIGPRSSRNDTTLTNAGTLRAANVANRLTLMAADVTNTGTIEVLGGGAVVAQSEIVSTGTITGHGAIGTTLLDSNGTISVSPGAALGLLLVDGNATFRAANTLRLEIGGAAVGEYDRFGVDGVLTLGGTLDVELLAGYVPPAGTTFQVLLLEAPAVGGFATLDLPVLPADRAWDTSQLGVGQLAVVPEPAAAAAAASVMLFVAGWATRRRAALRPSAAGSARLVC